MIAYQVEYWEAPFLPFFPHCPPPPIPVILARFIKDSSTQTVFSHLLTPFSFPQLFEGLKAFRGVDNKIRLFRPDLNMKRMYRSAVRTTLPVCAAMIPSIWFVPVLYQTKQDRNPSWIIASGFQQIEWRLSLLHRQGTSGKVRGLFARASSLSHIGWWQVP